MRKRAVSILVGILTAAIIAFDVYLATDGIPDNTYSARITLWSSRHVWVAPLIVAGMGFLAWHWFRNTAAPSRWGAAVLCILALIAGGLLAELIRFY